MCDLTEVPYRPGDVVWVKLGNCWWPGEVQDMTKLAEDVLPKKPPLAVVKFFSEDSYEYVKNLDNIYHYNNRRKMEFIKKGMDLTRAKSKQGSNVMDKFPTDVVTAESLTDGDVDILTTDAFVPEERPQYKDLFGSPKKKSAKKNGGPGRPSLESKLFNDKKGSSPSVLGKVKPLIQLKQRITHPRFLKESDHEVRIRQQPTASAPTSSGGENHAYKCQQCDFGTSRQNVFILHCKAHRDNVIQPTSASKSKPSSSTPNKKRVSNQSKPRKSSSTSRALAVKSSSTPKASASTAVKIPKEKMTPKEVASAAAARRKIFQPDKKGKRGAKASPATPVKTAEDKERDLEKRKIILADWEDEDEEEEQNESKKLKLELNQQTSEQSEESRPEEAPAKPVAADPSSVYDLIEDAEEIVPPRRSEPKRVREVVESTKETEELNKEVADLLEETAVPELPQVPSLPTLGESAAIPSLKSDTPSISSEKNLPELEQVVSEAPDAADSANLNGAAAPEATELVPPPTSTPAVATVVAPAVSEVLVAATSASSPAPTMVTNGALLSEPSVVVQAEEGTSAEEVVVDPNTETATYVLVTIDDASGFQQFQTIEGMGNTTLLAYDGSQGDEGDTRTYYIDPSQLGGSGAGLENLILALQEGQNMVQLQPQQVALQVAPAEEEQLQAAKAKQDILAVALANTQVLQPSPMETMVAQDSVVKVTNTAQSPVMTPRVTESQTPSKLAAAQAHAQHETAATIITLGESISGIR